MKDGFPRSQAPASPPVELRPVTIQLPNPVKKQKPDPKPWWIVVVAVGVIGLVLGLVFVSFASGARMFNGAAGFMPILMIGGVMAMMFGRMGGGQQMSRGKLDSLRADCLALFDDLRGRVGKAADDLDANYRWYHPPVETLVSEVGSRRMWERSAAGSDPWFGVIRLGNGLTSLQEANVVAWVEPKEMPTDIELEPATGKALQDFVKYQSVAYRTPALISLLVEPGYRLVGPREQVLGLARAVVAQASFAHGADHLQIMVVTDDPDEWEWCKWLPHCGDPRREDAAGPIRMVYRSVGEFYEAQLENLLGARTAFIPRHGGNKSPVVPLPHILVVSDIDDLGWQSAVPVSGVAGVTFLDARGEVPAADGSGRLLRLDADGLIDAVPRDTADHSANEEQEAQFFALADQLSRNDAEIYAQRVARYRLAESYEVIGDVQLHRGPRDICGYYKIDDPAHIDFAQLWAARGGILSRDRLRVPIGTNAVTGELMMLDIKDMAEGGDGPHGLMSGTTGSGKTQTLRTFLISLLLGHHPEDVQIVAADCKGGSGVRPFEGVPHVPHVITDLEGDQDILDRFVDALWGEIARRKKLCDDYGADDLKSYHELRADRLRMTADERARVGVEVPPPLPALLVVVDEFKELFRLYPEVDQVFDQICRQGRSMWVHLLMASQDIDSRAEKLLENVSYRMVLRAQTQASAAAAGVPNAVNLARKPGLGYLRLGPAENMDKFQAEFMWRTYRKPGAGEDIAEVEGSGQHFLEPAIFGLDPLPLPASLDWDGTVSGPSDGAEPAADEGSDDPDEDVNDMLVKPQVGRVIIDQLRRVEFEPYRLWKPPLDQSRTIEEIVNMRLGRRWDDSYGGGDLVFPIGIIDRPFKHDQQPLMVDTAGGDSNVLIIGAQGAGKTTALQTLICSAAMTHTPEQVQFYCLAFSSTVLGTIADLPHVGTVAYALDEEGVRRTTAELLALLRQRQKSFERCRITSLADFRARKFTGAPGEVPDDPYGDVYLAVDDFAVLTSEQSPIRTKELIEQQIVTLISEGRSVGIHVIATVSKESDLPPKQRSVWGGRVELRLASGADDARLVRGREANKVPMKPGRGMVAQNYPRLGHDPVGLHTLVARPVLETAPPGVFDSDSVVSAVRELAKGYRPAPAVRRLPDVLTVQDLAQSVAARGTRGSAFAANELGEPVTVEGLSSGYLLVTGRDDCGKTTALAAIINGIQHAYAPGASSVPDNPDEPRPRAQIWLIDPRRHLLPVVRDEYLERFAYRLDEVKALSEDLAKVLYERMPKGQARESLGHKWTGPHIFLIMDDADRLPGGMSSPLGTLGPMAGMAADVGLRIIYARAFGGWASGYMNSDPILTEMRNRNGPLLVMDSDREEGPVRGRWYGHHMPPGRGYLMTKGESGLYVQVASVPTGERESAP